MSSKTLSTTEAAKILGCTRQNVADLYRRHQLSGPVREQGSPVRIFASSVESYRQQREQRSMEDTSARSGGSGPEELLRAIRALGQEVADLRRTVERIDARERERSSRLADLDALHVLIDEAETQSLDAQIKAKEAEVSQLLAQRSRQGAARGRWTLMKEMASATIPVWEDS